MFGGIAHPPNNNQKVIGKILIPWLGNLGRPGQMHTTAAGGMWWVKNTNHGVKFGLLIQNRDLAIAGR